MKRCCNCFESINDELEICPFCGYIDGSLPENGIHLSPGSVVADRYLIGNVLGFDESIVEYLGWDCKLDQKVAIKEYLPCVLATRVQGSNSILLSDDSVQDEYLTGLQEFIDEANRSSKANNVDGSIRIFDCISENNTAYIISEYSSGEITSDSSEQETASSKAVNSIPLWLKILVPSVLSVFVLIGVLLATGVISFKSSFRSDVEVPDGYVIVPLVEGLNVDKAIDMLNENGIGYVSGGSVVSEYVDPDLVVYQDPGDGKIVPLGSKVTLTVSRGNGEIALPQDGISVVPAFIWGEENVVVNDFNTAGLNISVSYDYDENVTAGQVIRACDGTGNELHTGDKIPEGTMVNVFVSMGINTGTESGNNTVPNLTITPSPIQNVTGIDIVSPTETPAPTPITLSIDDAYSAYRDVLSEYESDIREIENADFGAVNTCALTDITGDGIPELIILYSDYGDYGGFYGDFGADICIFTVIPGETTATEMLHISRAYGFAVYGITCTDLVFLSNGNLLTQNGDGDEDWIVTYKEYELDGYSYENVNTLVDHYSPYESDSYYINGDSVSESDLEYQVEEYKSMVSTVLIMGPYYESEYLGDWGSLMHYSDNATMTFDEAWDIVNPYQEDDSEYEEEEYYEDEYYEEEYSSYSDNSYYVELLSGWWSRVGGLPDSARYHYRFTETEMEIYVDNDDGGMDFYDSKPVYYVTTSDGEIRVQTSEDGYYYYLYDDTQYGIMLHDRWGDTGYSGTDSLWKN